MPIQRFVVGPMGNNTYVVFDEASKEAAIVDPAKGSGPVLVWMTSHGLMPKYVLNTHGRHHFLVAGASQVLQGVSG